MSEKRSKEEADAINFLLFSYFGVTLDDNACLLMKSAVRKAYADATQRGAFNTSAPKDSHEKGEWKQKVDKAKSLGTQYLIPRIASLKSVNRDLENTQQTGQLMNKGFDVWHHQTCLTVRGFFQSVQLNEFTYGNAQKWVNMTLKYLYVLHALTKCKELDFIGRITGQLHVPIDSYIIESVWKDKNVSLPIPQSKLLQDHSRGKYSSDKVLSWSNWDCGENDRCKEYDSFQDSLRESLRSKHEEPMVPIEWEGPAWIAQAKKRGKGQ